MVKRPSLYWLRSARFKKIPKRHSGTGFTIVELLIVIVVIGILAAITVVAYNGVQQKAQNTAVINAAKQVQTLLAGYEATYDKHPSLGGYCLTVDNSCTNYVGSVATSDNTYFLNELRKIGQPPDTVSKLDPAYYGLYYDGYAPRTYNHDKRPGLLMYWLRGKDQPCQLQGVVRGDSAPLPGETNAFLSATLPWYGTTTGRTTCWISV